MSAVVESIAELGFQRSTAAEIARRAGITWGAVQHHFGGKDGILVAVLEDSFTRFAERLIDIDVDGVPLERRVALFVERAWQHFASPDFRSTFEILQHYAADSASDGQMAMLASWNRIWSRIFDDAHLSLTRRASLQHFTISFLVGRASLVRFKPVPARVLDAQLELLDARRCVRELRPERHDAMSDPGARRLDDYSGALEPDFAFERLTHDALARLGRELMLFAHFHDRGLMPLLGARFGRGVMTEIACDEWMGASPVYSRRLREGLGIRGDGVSAILKTLQLDVGFAHRYMDVRYELVDESHGWFWLPFCGAYQDVNTIFRGAEAEIVRLCHHMEDPTFDATAMAVNPRARVRPEHRPPLAPDHAGPTCRWRVFLDPDGARARWRRSTVRDQVARSRAASLPLRAACRADARPGTARLRRRVRAAARARGVRAPGARAPVPRVHARRAPADALGLRGDPRALGRGRRARARARAVGRRRAGVRASASARRSASPATTWPRS